MNTHIDEIYKDLIRDVLDNGELIEGGRTSESYLSVFGRQYRVNLRDGFPLLTTKKIFFKGVVLELLFFLKALTSNKWLTDQGVHIWDSWLDEDGNVSAMYGKSWRQWTTFRDYGDEQIPKKHLDDEDDPLTYNEYLDEIEYKIGKTRNTAPLHGFRAMEKIQIDQVANVIERIKTNPKCRRLIISAWNPAEIDKVLLPPCHTLYQFKVSHNGTKLNCHLFSRSSDLGLGLPFNIASYALLTHMIAQVCNLEVGEFVHSISDLHIYTNQIGGLKEQLTREPYKLPQLELNKNIKNIDDFKLEDIKIIGYQSHPTIKLPVSV